MAKNKAKSGKLMKKLAKANAKSTTATQAAETSKANAEQTAQPGVIATIISCLESAKKHKKLVTSGEILDVLCKTFPQRKREGMIITVRAQLSRIPEEKGIKITKVRDGRVVRYAAA